MRLVIGVALVLLLTSCGTYREQRVPEQTICGTVSAPHVRVEDDWCDDDPRIWRWFSADPRGLDFTDYTPVGQVIDDDYTDDRAAPRTVYVPTPTTTRTTTPLKPRTTTIPKRVETPQKTTTTKARSSP